MATFCVTAKTGASGCAAGEWSRSRPFLTGQALNYVRGAVGVGAPLSTAAHARVCLCTRVCQDTV